MNYPITEICFKKNIIFKDRVGNVSQWARSYAQRSATYRRPSHDSLPSILNSISGSGESENENENENIEPPSLRRRGLLPPIQLSPDNNIFLPGIFLVCTFFKVVSISQGRNLGCSVGFGIASSISVIKSCTKLRTNLFIYWSI